MPADLLFGLGLMVIGLVLIFVEVAVAPGFGVIGILGLGVVGLGVYYLWEAGGPAAGLTGALTATALTAGGLWWFFRSKRARSFVLATSIGGTSTDTGTYQALLGAEARTVGALRPSGVVEIDGERHDAVLLDGAWLPPGATVRVVGHEHGQLRVEPVEPEPEPPAEPNPPT